ncbi:MAG: hypothetical protein VW983_13970, partial [Halieaceae bacterium]
MTNDQHQRQTKLGISIGARIAASSLLCIGLLGLSGCGENNSDAESREAAQRYYRTTNKII